MRVHTLHDWNVAPLKAIQLQHMLALHVQTDPSLDIRHLHTVAGIDVSFNRYNPLLTAAIIVCRYPTLKIIERVAVQTTVHFPYIPGLLSFREIPAILQALEKLRTIPDVFLVDGQGIAHPRRLGIASHLGIMLDRPTIGVAKSPLVGNYHQLPLRLGTSAQLYDGAEQVGVILQTKKRAHPLYISVGNRIDLPSALKVVKGCLRGYRLPEPTRQAHLYANEVRREQLLRTASFRSQPLH